MHTNSISHLRILLVDDHALTREALTALLSTQPDMLVVAHACNGQESLELFRQCRPDVTLMDVSMPVMDGIKAVRSICEEFLNAVILMLTTELQEAVKASALCAGAKTYLLKTEGHEALFDAIRFHARTAG